MIPTLDHLTAAGVKRDRANQWIKSIQLACDEFGINTYQRIAGFLAQCAHETGGFVALEENLYYKASTLATVWPRRFAVLDADKQPIKVAGKNQPNKFALALHMKPELIANTVYANRMGNGSIESGEGWKYRGRGLKQLTGKDNHKRCGLTLNADLVAYPELLLQPMYASRSAAWFWKVNGLSAYADKNDIEGMTRKINGGLIGIADRKKRWAAVLNAA